MFPRFVVTGRLYWPAFCVYDTEKQRIVSYHETQADAANVCSALNAYEHAAQAALTE